ncbi:MAG TPA: LCP family protein [Solirubrobacteraceae bacterium]|nr:LCP family protein [Solirubrobacteraceae bacterium]
MPPGTAPEPPRRRWWLAWRVAAAAVGVVALSGGATAAIALNEVSRLTEALEQNKPVKLSANVLAPTSRGAPETLLLVGNDERAPPKDDPEAGPVLPHSNEMLLVRIDPSKPTVSMLSIPRELKVPIDKPDGEVEENRINSAYTYGWENGGGTAGGVKLMLETIKRVLGITVNHVFITNFQKFAKAVNAMGCVYMTVDKRYYHSNSEPGAEQYFEINLHPGYQKLCGLEALEFVANRHESTSLIRDARDQRFLLETKAEYGASLFSHREKFERIFGKYVESTLGGEEEILQLLYLLVESAGKPVRQVDFHVNLEPTFDSATPEQIHEAVSSFMNGTTAIAQHALAPPARPAATHPRTHAAHRPAAGLGFALTPTLPSELEEARSQAPNLPFPLEYPRVRDSFAETEPDELRLYTIHDLHGHPHPIYCIVIDRGELGQYYDVQGTNWTDPPMLNDPGQTIQVGKRTYELFYAGEQVRAIAWHEDGAVYWIENTLTDNVSPRAMLEMATQTVPVISTAADPTLAAGPAPPANIDLAPRSAASTTLSVKLGALLGFAGLIIVALLSPLVLARQREVSRLRAAVAQALALETRQRPLLAAAGITVAEPSTPAGTGMQTVAGPPAGAAMSGITAPALTASGEPPRSVYRARRHFALRLFARRGRDGLPRE